MAESLYNVAITKHTSDKPLETLVQEALAVLDKTGDPYMEYKLSEALLFGQSGPVLENLTLSASERVQQKLLNISIETLLQLATTAQEQSEPDTETETDPETEEAIKNPGLSKKLAHQPAVIGGSIVAVAAMGVAAFFLVNEFNKAVSPEIVAPLKVVIKSDAPATTDPVPAQLQLAAHQPAPEKNTQTSLGARGRATQQSQSEAGDAAVVPTLSAAELAKLKAILKSVKQQGFGYTESGQYSTHIEKLNRLLEMDKPDLALVFAETASDTYAAALLVLKVVQAEQQKQRVDYHDDILFTMKAILGSNKSKSQQPLLTAALSQAYAMLGDTDSATHLLQQALQETDAEPAEQQIDYLGKMITSHQHFAQVTVTRQLIAKLETMATKAAREEEPDQALIGNVYVQLAAIALQDNDLTAATDWLKHIPVPEAREDLLSYLDKIEAK